MARNELEEAFALHRRGQFQAALELVLDKHAELFRRLALSELEDDRERLIDEVRD